MKTWGKIVGMVLGMVLFIALGYHLVMVNLAVMLDAGRVEYALKQRSGTVILQVGRWVETIPLRFPVSWYCTTGTFRFQSAFGTLAVQTEPRFKINWEKPPRERGDRR